MFMMTISSNVWILCEYIHNKIFIINSWKNFKTQNSWLTFSQKIFDIFRIYCFKWCSFFFEHVLQIVMRIGLLMDFAMQIVIILNVNLMEVIVQSQDVIFWFFLLNEFLWQGVNLFLKKTKEKIFKFFDGVVGTWKYSWSCKTFFFLNFECIV